MTEGPVDQIAALLEEAAETHHRVYRITDGTDEDWASWYAEWLLALSELPEALDVRPVRSHLVHALVQCDLDYTSAGTDEPWPRVYARELTRRFSSELRNEGEPRK
jgi:hypothetical protein